MTGKSLTLTFALAAGLLAGSLPAGAHDDRIVVQRGNGEISAVTFAHNEGGSGVEVHRGPAKLLPPAPAAAPPVSYINGERVRLDRLEPTGNWFLDRSGDRVVLVHCYATQSSYVGGAKRIRCSARDL